MLILFLDYSNMSTGFSIISCFDAGMTMLVKTQI